MRGYDERMPSLRTRVIEPEILDTLPPDAARASLGDLVRINRGFGGHSALRHALDEAGASGAFTALDVGAASGDMGARIREWFPQASVVSLDSAASHLAAAAQPKVAADGFRLPFARAAFDYVYSSLFLHHFEDDGVVRLLAEMGRVARRAVLAVDLHRHPVAYWFLPATRWVFGWDAVTLNDGPISVAAAFRPRELADLAERAGLKRARARSRGLSFRVTLVADVE